VPDFAYYKKYEIKINICLLWPLRHNELPLNRYVLSCIA